MVESLMGMGWWLVAAVLVAILGAGRWARLITYDKFPPAAWWLFWGWGALAYVASMVIARDEPKE